MKSYYKRKMEENRRKIVRRARKIKRLKRALKKVTTKVLKGLAYVFLIGVSTLLVGACTIKCASMNTVDGHWEKNPNFISRTLTPYEDPNIWVEEE